MDYNAIGLQSLRALAQSIGVKRPTTYNKAQLIEKIIEVESGECAPHFTKRGRPIKKIVLAESLKENLRSVELKKDIMNQLQCAMQIIKQVIEQVSKL